MNIGRIRKTLPVAPAAAVIGADGKLDVDALLAFHHSIHGDARMEETPEEKAAREAAEKAARDSKTYTQAELDRLLSREKDQGERAGETKGMRKALEQLGVDPDKVKVEDLAATLKKAIDADEAAKTEAEKARDAATAERTAAEKLKGEAAQEKHDTRVERLLTRAGLRLDEDDDKKRDKQIAQAMKLVDVEVGADSDKIRDAINDLKEDMPGLFGAEDDDDDADTQRRQGRRAPDSDVQGGGSGRKGGRHGTGEFGAKGLEELKRRGYITEQEKASA